MKKNDLVQLIRELGIRPSRKLGQNFLIDGNVRDRITELILPAAAALIVEVGPGTGVLTDPLLASGTELIAIEYDNRLAAYLADRHRDTENFRITHRDACRVDF